MKKEDKKKDNLFYIHARRKNERCQNCGISGMNVEYSLYEFQMAGTLCDICFTISVDEINRIMEESNFSDRLLVQW